MCVASAGPACGGVSCPWLGSGGQDAELVCPSQ